MLLLLPDSSCLPSTLNCSQPPRFVPQKAAWTIDADNVHWRPNCRLFKVDKAAMGKMQDPQQQQEKSTPDHGLVNGTHSRGNTQQPHASQQDQQQTQQPGSSKQKPPAAPSRLSVPPSPLQAGVESVGVLSPDSAGGPSPGGVAYNAAVEKAVEVAAKRGVQRIPAGEVGAGLPVVQGGAGERGWVTQVVHRWSTKASVGQQLHVSGDCRAWVVVQDCVGVALHCGSCVV